MTSSLRQGWFHLAGGAGAGRLIGFFSNLLLSRYLGPTALGSFYLFTTTVQTADTLSRLGFDYSLAFHTNGNPSSLDPKRWNDLKQAFIQVISTSSISISAIFFVLSFSGLSYFNSLFETRISQYSTLILTLMIFFECVSLSAWEILLVNRRTSIYALRQGIFLPVRILVSALAAISFGLQGALLAWLSFTALQYILLKSFLGTSWSPFLFASLKFSLVKEMARKGLPFYFSNLLSLLVFYPLLLQVADTSGVEQLGFLRVGQILQQAFAFLPSTLVPILFLDMRMESSFTNKVARLEKPLRSIWLLLFQILLIYCLLDNWLLMNLFGSSFDQALAPTRLLLITSLFECLSQLSLQPILAAGYTRTYVFWQNAAALISALLGILFIPSIGLIAYVLVRLFYIVFPLFGFWPMVLSELRSPLRILPLLITTVLFAALLIAQSLHLVNSIFLAPLSLLFSVYLLYTYRSEYSYSIAALINRNKT